MLKHSFILFALFWLIIGNSNSLAQSTFTDDFSGDLSAWTDVLGNNWSIINNELHGYYNVSCGSGCQQSDLVLNDEHQIPGDWVASIDFIRVADDDHPDLFQAVANFTLWLAIDNNISLSFGGSGWNYWGGQQNQIQVSISRWLGVGGGGFQIIAMTLDYTWTPEQWHTGSIKKVGNNYSLYIDDNFLVEFQDTILNGTGKIGLHTYGTKRYDNFILEPLSNDFATELTVSDNCSNSQGLTFGTAPDATDFFDPAYDVYAPPPPPSGAFDGRFVSNGDGLLRDFRATNADSIIVWDVYYQPASGCDPVSFSWDPVQLPPDGNFTLIDFATGGTLVNVNMRTNNSYTDNTGLGHLQIYFNYTVTNDYNIVLGWDLLSLPLDVDDPYYLTLFPNAETGTLFGFNGSYYSTDTVNTLTGYWLKFPADETVTVEGIEITQASIDLTQGWNMIGGPNCDVPLISVGDPGSIIEPGTLFGFNGSYYTADTLKQGLGYWVKANANGTITMDCSTVLAKDGDRLLAPLTIPQGFSTVEITDAGNSSQTLYFGGKLDNNVNIESYSLPPVPPKGSFDVRLGGGYRLTESGEFTVMVQAAKYPLRLKITGISTGYVVKELNNGKEIKESSVISGEELIITDSKVNLLRIQKGSVMPTRFVLEQNYPNPFNPVTQIKYGITETGNVELIIYNTLGERVKTLINKTQEAGYYTVQWNGTNSAGAKVGSGVYLYSLRAGSNYSVKKMILLK